MSEQNTHTPRYVVCVTAETPHVFDDDSDATCALCGAAVYHRPHALSDVPGAVPICLPCYRRVAAQHPARDGAVKVGVTARVLREVQQELARREGTP